MRGRWVRHAALIAGLVCCYPPHIQAENVRPLRFTLRAALQMAQRRQLDVLIAQERVQQAIARFGQALSTLMPQVTSNASQTRQTKNLEAAGITLPGQPALVGPFNTFDARLRLTQTLFDVAALHRLREARAGRARSLAEYEQARQDAMALVAALYLEAARAADGVELGYAVLVRDAERLRLANQQADLGTESALIFRQAEVEYADSLQRWHAALAEASERRLDLVAALGMPSAQPLIFVQEDAPYEPIRPSAAPPVIQAAEERVHERAAERAATMAEFLPTVSAGVDYGASGRTLSQSEATYGVTGQVSLPIFEGGLRVAKVREATSQLRESQARLTDAQHHVEAQTLSAEETLQHAVAVAQARETALVVSLRFLELARLRARTGMGSELEVTEAVAQAALAKDQHHEARAAVQLAQVNLAHAMGTMDTLLEHL